MAASAPVSGHPHHAAPGRGPAGRIGRHLFRLLFLALVATGGRVEPAASSEALVVYIECRSNDDPSAIRRGSGVVVSADGHVLTARHVAPEGYACRGALGSRTEPLRGLIPTHHNLNINPGIDGRVLRFVGSPGETFRHARYCRVTPALVGRRLQAFGFHEQSVAEPSVTSGILSTSIPSELGILETDVMTVRGKSGGPVFLEGSDDLVGIVAGAQFDALGLPIFYGILVAEAFAVPLAPLLELSDGCGPVGSGDDEDAGGTTLLPLASESAHYWAYPAAAQWSPAPVSPFPYRVGVSHTEDMPPAGESLAVFSFDIGAFAGKVIRRAELDLAPADVIGDPYGTLGVLGVEQISVGDLSQSIMAPATEHSQYLTAPPQGPLDVTLATRAAVERGARSLRFRLRFFGARLTSIDAALAAPDAFLGWEDGPRLTIHADD